MVWWTGDRSKPDLDLKPQLKTHLEPVTGRDPNPNPDPDPDSDPNPNANRGLDRNHASFTDQ